MKYLKVWTSFLDVLKPLSEAEIGRLFLLMLQYAENSTEPADFVGNERFIWPVAKQIIDLAEERNEKLRANASKGGLAKSRNKQELANDSKVHQSVATVSCKGMERKEKERNEKESKEPISLLATKKRFVPPTAEEIQAYCDERGVYLIDPHQFVDYYQARGWMLTKSRTMIDWKAAVRTWEKNERDRQKQRYADDIPY